MLRTPNSISITDSGVVGAINLYLVSVTDQQTSLVLSQGTEAQFRQDGGTGWRMIHVPDRRSNPFLIGLHSS